VRYHSLIVERASIPEALEITAETEDGMIMALRHQVYPITGVQFHPESILTQHGKDLLRNFLGEQIRKRSVD
jgi:para-aminobenzoate synthetase component 2